MPPYYSSDNLQCWFRALIEEQFECLESNEDRLYYIERLSTIQGLKEFCDETIEDIVDKKGSGKFAEALMNSVDWDELLDDVTNDMEEEKKALLDEEESEKKSVCEFCDQPEGECVTLKKDGWSDCRGLVSAPPSE
jgi:hypothetical protein